MKRDQTMNETDGISVTSVVGNDMQRLGMRARRVLGALLLMLMSMQAWAGSVSLQVYRQFGDLTFSSISPGRDRSVGTNLQSLTSANGGINTTGVTCSVTKTTTVNGTPVPGMTSVYQTNVPGIGVRLKVTSGWTGNFMSTPSTEVLAPRSDGSLNFYTGADLVVTGPIGTGALTDLPTMTLTYTGDCITPIAYTQTLVAGAALTGLTCSVTTAAVDVPLPTINAGNLATGSAGKAPFNLAVNCTQGVTVKITLTDASNVSNKSTTLGLLPDSTATGVRLQILNGTTPVAYGPDSAVSGNVNQWTVGTSAGGPMTIPLTAQYVKSGTPTPGSVKGAATFTMSYQ
ncbi:fimbrial protein [Paraburkholderia sp. IW21]|uniref:fimbrial protein n=1 Tax=Paraburkholderia sp. IW21 TaxID=3242488 RepID=UPI00351FC24C